ncbi:porin [Caballeronia choica]|uniref:Porin n=1 Tax=Caballeronia choica TaxID=326476 RepID=A0A158IWW0_9BURK|nr:porin [Caballeronia choica]SAL61068.1 porin [Caballeronia choica]
MKKNGLLLCMLALASSTALAQSSVTLYGIIDTGVEYVSHANANGDSVIRMPGITGEYPSRWGLRGSEDLGGGYAAQFVLESGFNPRAGDLGQGGRLFGRQAWTGLSSSYGTLMFGRQYTATYLIDSDADILGPNIYGIASLDAYVPNARSDNTVGYKGAWRGFTLGATYSFGRDSAGTGNSPGQGTCAGSAPGQFTQCRQISTYLRYDSAVYGLAGAYDEQRGGPNAAANFFNGNTPIPITNPGDKDVRLEANGWVKLQGVKIGAGWIGRNVVTSSVTVPGARSNLFYLGASYLVTPSINLDGEVFRIVNAAQDARATLGVVRGTYLLSARTAVYLQTAYLANSAHARYSVSAGGGGTTPPAGQGQLGVMAGLRQSF